MADGEVQNFNRPALVNHDFGVLCNETKHTPNQEVLKGDDAMRDHHEASYSYLGVDKPLECSVCSMKFSNSHIYAMHWQIYGGKTYNHAVLESIVDRKAFEAHQQASRDLWTAQQYYDSKPPHNNYYFHARQHYYSNDYNIPFSGYPNYPIKMERDSVQETRHDFDFYNCVDENSDPLSTDVHPEGITRVEFVADVPENNSFLNELAEESRQISPSATSGENSLFDAKLKQNCFVRLERLPNHVVHELANYRAPNVLDQDFDVSSSDYSASSADSVYSPSSDEDESDIEDLPLSSFKKRKNEENNELKSNKKSRRNAESYQDDCINISFEYFSISSLSDDKESIYSPPSSVISSVSDESDFVISEIESEDEFNSSSVSSVTSHTSNGSDFSSDNDSLFSASSVDKTDQEIWKKFSSDLPVSKASFSPKVILSSKLNELLVRHSNPQ